MTRLVCMQSRSSSLGLEKIVHSFGAFYILRPIITIKLLRRVSIAAYWTMESRAELGRGKKKVVKTNSAPVWARNSNCGFSSTPRSVVNERAVWGDEMITWKMCFSPPCYLQSLQTEQSVVLCKLLSAPLGVELSPSGKRGSKQTKNYLESSLKSRHLSSWNVMFAIAKRATAASTPR